jgi:hypothetical protein
MQMDILGIPVEKHHRSGKASLQEKLACELGFLD